jgi:hypothetical protein
MSFKSNSESTIARHCGFLTICFAAFLVLTTPVAHAGEGGMRGWAFCTTYAPYSSAYVAGDPVYASEVFYEDGTRDVGLLRRNFLKQKYGWTKNAGCSIATASDGQASQLRDSSRFTEQARPKLVHTEWKAGMKSDYTSATLPATPAQTSAAISSGAGSGNSQGSTMYWVCTWGNGNGTIYISGAFAAGTFTGNQVGPTELIPPFQRFVVAKYGVPAQLGGAECIYRFSEAGAQALLQQRISKPPSGMHVVQTGWKYGMNASGGAAPMTQGAPAPVAAAPAAPEAVQVQSTPGPPVITNVTVRLVDAVNSSTDPAGKRYRAVVTREATAGNVQIPQNTLASITLAQQSAGTFSAQLVSLKLNGQDVTVTSTAATATSMAQQAQQAAKKIGGFLSSFGKQSAAANQATSAISTAGNHVSIPPGTSLTFATSVPQPGVPVTSAPPPQSAIAAPGSSQGSQGENGERGPDGQIIGGTTSGVMTAYYCTAETIPPGKHRQTTYVTVPFNSAQPQLWITFWFSQHIHQTYNIPSNVSNYTVDCNTFGKKTAAQQQADVTRWKERNDDVVQLHWVPTQTPTPGVSVGQLNNMTGQIVTGAIGSNMPPYSNPAGSVALCDTAVGGKEYLSNVFPAGNHRHEDFELAYGNNLAKKYGSGKVVGNITCMIVPQTRGQATLQQWKKEYATHNIDYVETGWSYSGPESGPLKVAQAPASSYVLCTASGGSDKRAFASAIFKAGGEEHLVIEQAFLKYLVTTFGPGVSHNTSCMKERYLENPQRYINSMKNQAPGNGFKVVDTGWTYNGAEPVTAANAGSGDADPDASAGGQYVLCYSDANESPLYFSANFHLDVPPAPGAQSGHTDHGRSAKAIADLTQEFVRFLQKQYGYRSAISIPAYCDGSASSTKPDEERQIMHERFSKLKMIETGWKPGAAPPTVAAGVPSAPANPYSSVGGVYTGTYTCAKGPVDMKVKLSLNESSILTGTMTFYLPPGSHTKAYTFSLGGPLNQTSGSFNLRPMRWEGAEPPNYVMVGLNGTANPQSGRISGKVDYSGCGNFEAMKGRED